jgi:hypothetical protein
VRVFEERVSRKIFEPRGDEVTGELGNYIMKILTSALLTIYYSSDKIEKNEIGEACSMYVG